MDGVESRAAAYPGVTTRWSLGPTQNQKRKEKKSKARLRVFDLRLLIWGYTMDEQVLELLESLIEGRNDFFVQTMRLTPHNQRASMMSRYMLNEVCYIEMLNRLFQHHSRNQLASTILTFALPNTNFSDPVAVVPTQAQITSALETFTDTGSNCAICQDSISSGGCRIRHCGHVYHRSCIVSWFALNVRCPVCRHDIREAGQANQTHSDEE